MFNKLRIYIAKLLANNIGYTLIRDRSLNSLKIIESVVPNWINWYSGRSDFERNNLSIVIFSKNRPLQLDALLESIKTNIASDIPIYIIFYPENEDYDSMYLNVFMEHDNLIKQAYNEKMHSGFEWTLKSLINKIPTSHIMFLVDDIIFINKVNLEALLKLDIKKYIPSLRLGLSINYSYAHDKTQEVPPFNYLDSDEELLTWKWAEGEMDWGYPFSLDGHIFSTTEIQIFTSAIHFKGPNKLEQQLQLFNLFTSARLGCCFSSPCLVNNPANRVQNEFLNRSGDTSPEELLSIYMSGKRIDTSQLQGMKVSSCHQEFDYPLNSRVSI